MAAQGESKKDGEKPSLRAAAAMFRNFATPLKASTSSGHVPTPVPVPTTAQAPSSVEATKQPIQATQSSNAINKEIKQPKVVKELPPPATSSPRVQAKRPSEPPASKKGASKSGLELDSMLPADDLDYEETTDDIVDGMYIFYYKF
jgi:hypothetical protein